MSEHFDGNFPASEYFMDMAKSALDAPSVDERYNSYLHQLMVPGSVYDRAVQIETLTADGIEQGVMPQLNNGFEFVIDRRTAPVDQGGNPEDLNCPITAREYTSYFSQGRIPIADVDHLLFTHDVGHVASYQQMFGSPMFANMIRQAASNALASNELCAHFTKYMNFLGDMTREVHDQRLCYIPRNVVIASRKHARKLLALADAPNTPQDVKPNLSENRLDELEGALGLRGYEAMCLDTGRSRSQTYGSILSARTVVPPRTKFGSVNRPYSFKRIL